jgi:hypothetical protein
MRSLVLFVVLVLSSTATAQPSGSQPAAARPMEAQPRNVKQRAYGYLLSSIGTVVPLLIVAASIGGDGDSDEKGVLLASATAVLTPSAGHWYAGRFFTTGMGIRLASGTVATLGLVMMIQNDEAIISSHKSIFIGGVIGVGIGAIWDIATVGSAVDDWNAKHAQVAPAVMKTGDGYGIGLVGSF